PDVGTQSEDRERDEHYGFEGGDCGFDGVDDDVDDGWRWTGEWDAETASLPETPKRVLNWTCFAIGIVIKAAFTQEIKLLPVLDVDRTDSASPNFGTSKRNWLLGSNTLKFREIGEKKGEKKQVLTEDEKAARWDDLLEFSAKVGGTIHLHGGGDVTSLPSDQISISASELLS
ncbi:hypothetical protein BDN72DRAFT_865483, partial [Pluteus cervinus]